MEHERFWVGKGGSAYKASNRNLPTHAAGRAATSFPG